MEMSALDAEILNDLLAKGLRQWRIDQALRCYAEKKMTFAAAAEYAGVPQDQFAREAYTRGMEPAFSAETVAEEA